MRIVCRISERTRIATASRSLNDLPRLRGRFRLSCDAGVLEKSTRQVSSLRQTKSPGDPHGARRGVEDRSEFEKCECFAFPSLNQ